MQYIDTKDLTTFDFWSGAKDHNFTHSELVLLDKELEHTFEDAPTATEINDLFWFGEDFLCACIGLDYDNDYSER